MTLISFLLGIWQLALVWAVGLALEKRLRLDLHYGYRMAVAFGLGETVLSYFYFALGLVGGLRFWVVVPLAVIASVLLLPAFQIEVRRMVSIAWPWIRRSPLASALSSVLFLTYLLGAIVPEREVDSLWYHLAVPLHYITHGGFIQNVPFNMPAHYPMNLHLHYTLSLLVGDETTCKVFILLHWLPMLILLWTAVRDYGQASWGMFAVTIYLSCLHFRLPVMVNNERSVYFFVFLSTLLLWKALEYRRWRELLLASLFCGMAMGVKFNGLLFAYIAQWMLMALWFFVLRREPFWDGLKKWIVHSLLAWLMMSPWMIKSWIYTHNPFYPMLGSLFNTYAEYVPAMLSNDKNHGLNILKSKTLTEFLSQISTNIGWLLFNPDLIFFLGLLALFVLLGFRKKKWFFPTISTLIAYGLFTLLWGSDIARLFAANYGVIVLAIALAISEISRRVSYGSALSLLIQLSLFSTFYQQECLYLGSPNIRWFGQVYLGRESRQHWLVQRGLFSHELFRMKTWMRSIIPAQDEIYGYRTGYLFYLDRKYIVSGGHFNEQMERWLPQGPGHTLQQLQRHNVKWLLFDEMALTYIGDEEKSSWENFRDGYLSEVHREGSIVLYRIGGTGSLSESAK